MDGWRDEGRAEQECEEDKDRKIQGEAKRLGERGKETVRRERENKQEDMYG